MKTLFDELQCEVKNWWLSLLLGILYVVVAVSLMFAPLSGYAVLSILFSISMLFSGLLEISFAVSNRKNVSSWGWYLAGGIIDMIFGFYLIAYPLLSMEVIPFIIDVPGLLICRLCYGSEKIWYKRLGLVYCFRHISRNLFAHHLMATGNRCSLCSLHDFIRIPDYRILPHHVVI